MKKSVVPKFLLFVDYMSNWRYNLPYDYEYKPLTADTIEEAITQADNFWRENKEIVYFIRIMKKSGDIQITEHTTITEPHNYKLFNCKYRAILCKRSDRGWKENTKKNNEPKHTIDMIWNNSTGIENPWYE